jgi:2-polyprenyl-6-methoxyphenol hydroxylase-like FAD-dependent oxidoreductase
MTLDPLSGQGLTFALESALEGVSALVRTEDGDRGAAATYAAAVRASFERQRAIRTAVYRLEQRFVGSRFWDRARAGSD